ncbi:MAG: TolC family protein, partial [Planctomycetota bacterium]|nr:TolC family protein [Planctomycetota bacterium]
GTAADRDALVHTLIASVVQQRVAISVAQRRLALAESIVSSRGQTLDIVDRRYRSGVGGISAVDVRLARENLATARADLPARRLDIERAQLALDVLLGRKPGGRPVAPVAMPAVPPLDPPPTGVPAALLDQRPDLQGSEFRILARTHDVEAAVAALYPGLTLRGTLGFRTEDVSKFLSLDRFIADLVGQITTRLFSGGQLEAEIDAARARVDAQAARYKAIVLNAVREVEDALVRERYLREQIGETAARVEHARAAETLARDRYGRGLENLLVVLETERRRRLAEELLLVLQGALWTARIDLHLALGGDWFSEESA